MHGLLLVLPVLARRFSHVHAGHHRSICVRWYTTSRMTSIVGGLVEQLAAATATTLKAINESRM